ncbi:MAG TPA: hypothetical protein VFO38_04710 [Candidatus Saccharimonadales bacterium]|nr:hypothetical protein [Candidatus Saccharimonadales bacterium]
MPKIGMSEPTKVPSQEVNRYEFEPNLTEAERVAVAGLIEDHEPGTAQVLQQNAENTVMRSVTLGKGLLQKPLDT